jgi:hypothetical protein
MELVQVAVPADRLMEVYALLGTANTPAESAQKPSGESKPWTDKDLTQLLGEASETIRGEAKYLAGRPDETVTSEEIASELNLPKGWNSLAGANGAWGRKLKNRGYTTFPWKTWYDANDGLARMMMTAEMAAIVNKAV